MSQAGSRQHIIPASHIGSFSNDPSELKRERFVWFRRDRASRATYLRAKGVGIRKHTYTIHNTKNNQRYVDQTWDYVERNLNTALVHLEKHTGSPMFSGEIWITILVPFVSQLFVRGEDYAELLLKRAPALQELDAVLGANAIHDNNNFNRLIDFQINAGLLCYAEWRLLHNDTDTPFILNDLGYTTINAQRYGYGMGKGYLIPMSQKEAIVITRKNPVGPPYNPYGKQVMFVQQRIRDQYRIKAFNERIAKSAYSEIYGSTEEVVNAAWGDRQIRKKDPAIGPAIIHSPLKDGLKVGLHWK